MALREQVKHLVDWCHLNNLDLNINKIQEVVIDFRRNQPLLLFTLWRSSGDRYQSLGVHINNNRTRCKKMLHFTSKVPKRLHFLQRWRRAHLPSLFLTNFYKTG